MPLSLPKPIADYFAADTADGVAVAKCFSADAMVIDEKKTYRGRDAIAAWKSEASAKYDYVAEPMTVDVQGERICVTAHLTGNFPGSRWTCATLLRSPVMRSRGWRSSHELRSWPCR